MNTRSMIQIAILSIPKGMKSNWLSTEGKRPYVWLRLYGPGKAFWDKTFVMPYVKRLD